MKTLAIYGPPGCGKTTKLMSMIAEFIDMGYKANDIAFLSHTKAAAAEALTRLNLTRSDKVSTIHSQCYQLLGLSSSQLVDFRRLNEFASLIGIPIKNGSVESEEGIEVGDEYLGILNRARNRLVAPITEYHDSHRPGSLPQYESFITGYSEWKKANGYIDFTDMLERLVARGDQIDFKVKVMLVDESQDLSALQWAVIDILCRNCEHMCIAGDDDQCQPPGTKVLTPTGNKNIEDLVDGDKVVSYNQTKGYWSNRAIKVSSRYYNDDLIKVDVDGLISRYTLNHRCMVIFKYDKNTRVVYLMRKGGQFRIGQTKAFKFNSTGVSLYPVVRARQEQADDLWILNSFNSEKEAVVEEQLLSVKFGIPQTIFSFEGLGLQRSKFAHDIWENILKDNDMNLLERANALLHSLGKSISLPHIKHNGGTKLFKCYACNLDPNLHMMARSDGTDLNWVEFSRGIEHYDGQVHSLEVDKTSTYVADGIYTHNSIYQWGGADPSGMTTYEEQYDATRKILTQSHRIPSSVHAVALSIIGQVKSRVEKEYAPRTEAGSVERFGHTRALDLMHGEDTLILCRAGVQKKEMEKYLIESKIPYLMEGGKPGLYQTKVARAIKLYGKMRNGEAISATDLELLCSQASLKYRDSVRSRDFKDFLSVGHMKAINIPHWNIDFYRETDLSILPTIRVSSIHGSKGREADRVVLHTGLTERIAEGMDKDPDAEHRVMYVGSTRAKHRLDILEGHNGYNIG